jgi:hypothetical protein
MGRLLKSLAFVGLVALSAATHAQAAIATADPQPVHQATKLQESTEVVLLRTQLEDAKEFHDAILSTVYWALGGTFVLAGLLLGFGWLANFKVYERDKGAMKTELEAALIIKLNEIESSIREKLAEIPDLVATATKESVARSERTIKSDLATLSRKVFSIDMRNLKNKMENNPSTSMALTDALGLLELCVNKAPDEVPEIMHFMLKKIDTGGKLTAKEINRLNEVLDSLPVHFRTLKEKLSAKLVASDIF